ncbi:YifB family Mg chelatase-like AAA ATPase, partial [bacterium]|nr:YifB family Mg chelatase-like AAA ATPase [bacterium]
MVQRVHSGAVYGIDGYDVTVEVDVRRGLPTFQIVGLPGTTLRESRERVLSAMRNSGLSWPSGRVTVNLAPADVQKQGAAVDVAIAVGISACSRDDPPPPVRRDAVLLGELSLNGELRPVRGLLSIVTAAAGRGASVFVVPGVQAWQARLVPGITVLGADHLADVVAWHRTGAGLRECEDADEPRRAPEAPREAVSFFALSAPAARRLAVLAAAGRHDTLLVGPPGTGKTRLCRTIGALTPACSCEEAVEVTRIQGAAGLARRAHLCGERPFRAPHHTVTRAGLIGGGAGLRAGEVTLAHHGALFLDELAEFAPAVLDALREPLEEGRVAVSRGPGARFWPANFQFLGAMNPCRCGSFGSSRRACCCTASARARYGNRLSGPLLDRIDLFVEMEEAADWTLHDGVVEPRAVSALWEEARSQVTTAYARLNRISGAAGGSRRSPELSECRRWLDRDSADYLDRAKRSLGLSIRSLIRTARVAHTVAALAGRHRVRRS